MKYYVDISVFRDGDGSKERPFRHINDAAKIAGPGDQVLVASRVQILIKKMLRSMYVACASSRRKPDVITILFRAS